MSKWKRLPLVSKQVTDTNRHEHFAKTSITKTVMYHEQQRYENSDEEHTSFAFELHRKFSTSVSWEERKAWAGLFGHRPPSDPIITAKMKLKVEFTSASQVDDFFNILEQLGVPTEKVKTKPNSDMVLDINRDFHYRLIKALHAMSPFKDKMRRDVLAWHFEDPNCLEAQKFSAEVFGPVVELADKTESEKPTEIPAVSVSVETNDPVTDVINMDETDKLMKYLAQMTEVKVDEPSDNVSAQISETEVPLPPVEEVASPKIETVTRTDLEDTHSQPEVENESIVPADSSSVTEVKQLEKLITPPGSPTLFRARNEMPTQDPTPVEEPAVSVSNSPRL